MEKQNGGQVVFKKYGKKLYSEAGKKKKRKRITRGYLVEGDICPFCNGTGKVPNQNIPC